MGNKEKKKKLIGPWASIHTAVWLIGLAILAIKDWWWPGILVLVAISMILEAVLMQAAPHAFEEEMPQDSSSTPVEAAPPAAAVQVVEHRSDLLPSVCPKCGGPIRGFEVKWTGAQSADCPFCGANLPMRKNEIGALS